MTSADIFRDWRVGMIAGAALLHLTAFAGAWVMVPHDGVETRLDRPIEASLMPAPSNDMVSNDSAEIAKEVVTLNEQGETALEDTAEIVPPDAVEAAMVEPVVPTAVRQVEPLKPQEQAEAPAETVPQQLAALSPEIVTTTSPDVVTSVPVVPPRTEPAETVLPHPDLAKPKPRKAEKLKPEKPRPEKDVRKKTEPVVKPQSSPRAMAKLDTKTTIARTQQGGSGAVSDIGTASNALASGAARQSYIAIIKSQLNSHKRYPADARNRDAKGIAYVGFVISKQGAVGSVRLVKSSGDASLDAAAMALPRSLSLPPPPGNRGMSVASVPIQYMFR